MSVRLIRSTEHRVMPWKNGGGTTAEIAIAPDGASVSDDGFDWRLSLASIGGDGPFSAFPGIDRTIMLVEGNGMILTAPDNVRLVLDQKFLPQDFPGEWAVDCNLLDGPVRDLNLMVNRARMQARWQVVALGGEATLLADTGDALIVHALEGDANFVGIDGVHHIATGDTLIAGRSDLSESVSASGAGVIFTVALSRRE